MKLVGRTLLAILLLALLAGGLFYWNAPWIADQALRWRLWRAGVTSSYVTLDGHRIHYLEIQPPAGRPSTPIVLIHGLGGRAEDWAAMMPILAAHGFHVYAPDLLGYGRSDRPDVAYAISLEETVVADFMQAMQLPHADVGGWSMGGWIAMKLALDHPSNVNRLAIYDSAGMYFPATFDASLFTPTDPTGLHRLLAMLTPHPPSFPDFIARATIRRMRPNAWILRRSVAAMMSGRDLLEFRVYRIRQPMLIVWGEQDQLIPIANAETIHSAVPQSHLAVVQGCGHLAPSDCSGPVTEATLQFFQSNPPLTGGETVYPAPPRPSKP